jgi:hypothetical protein
MLPKQVSFFSARQNDFELVAEVGDPKSEEGLTRVRLSGDGRLSVEQERGEEKAEQFQGELDRENTEILLRQASQFDWEQHFPPRPGLPDEAIVQWFLHDRQGGTVTLKVWLRDAEKNRVMEPVLSTLRKSVEQMTYGKLYL